MNSMHYAHFTEKDRLNEHHLWQMQPLSILQAADLNNVIHISAMGTVTLINTKEASFIMHLTQYVSGGEIPHELAVCAELAKNTKWADPKKWVPQVKAVVSVWGTLQCFDMHVVSPNEGTKGIVIDMDDIQYMYNPSKNGIENPLSLHKKKTDLQQKFNRKDCKQNTTPLKASTSQV